MKLTIKSAAVVLFALSAAPMFAGTDNATINVKASVANVCKITAGADLDFGAYDPIITNASTAKNEATPGGLSVTCTKGTTTAKVGFASSSGTIGNGTDNLNYNLFLDATRLVAFGTDAKSLDFTGGKAAQTVSVYGKLPAGQDVSAGSYTGTATATLNW